MKMKGQPAVPGILGKLPLKWCVHACLHVGNVMCICVCVGYN